MIGQTISHYRILERLGEGGMGIVYKAEDTRLKRTVALKFLPRELSLDPDAKERFLQEAQAASSVQHQNICTIHDIDSTDDGQTFIVMDCYDGETLDKLMASGEVPVEKAVDITIQVARGLAEAHAHGLIHRDIKPGNIHVTRAGQVKILDFGVAKLASSGMTTRVGSMIGTLAYMSPEQAQGGQISQQTDLWSLGVVLYQMLSGKPPFRGEYESALYYSILETNPPAVSSIKPDVSDELSRILAKALAKDPTERYKSAPELMDDLAPLAGVPGGTSRASEPTEKRSRSRWQLYVGAGILLVCIIVAVVFLAKPPEGTQTIRSLAVLPLHATSGTPDAEPFADGMSEALITELSKVKGLIVKSWTSVRQYKDRAKSLPEIARELSADGIIEGSTELRGNRVGIRVRLIKAQPEQQLWSQDYIEDFQDLLSLERQVARAIVHQVRVVVTPEETARLGNAQTVNVEAQQAYFLGRFHWSKWTADGFRASLGYFQEAITRDTTFAPGYAGIADVWGTMWYMGMVAFDSVEARWRPAARKAVELDGTSGEAHVSLAATRQVYDWDWLGAEEELLYALTISPSYATGHHWYALLLSALGRHEEAVKEIRLAQELDPRSVIIRSSAGWIHLHARRYSEAITEFKKTLELDSLFAPAHSGLGQIYELTGRNREALTEYLGVAATTGGSFSTLRGRTVDLITKLKTGYDRGGWKGYWSEQLADLMRREPTSFVSAYHIASILARLGNNDEAFVWLGKAIEQRSTSLLFANVDPVLQVLRGDPRFASLLQTMKLPSLQHP